MKTIRAGVAKAPEKPSDRENRRYWGAVEPPKAKTEFFNAVAPTSGANMATVATIRMYGPIDSYGGWWGISTEDVASVLDALPESVEQIVLRINSPGGEVWEAMAILNMFNAHRATVTAVVDGLAASAASFIAAGCDETVMSPGSQMMIHPPSSIVWGDAVEMRKTADFLDKLQESIIEVYTAKAGEQDWAALLAEETWLTAADTVELGLADRVAVVPDAGTASTVGDDEPDILLVTVDPEEDGDAEARSVRVHAAAASARATAPKPPVSSEPGVPNQKGTLNMSDTIKAGLRERLGVTDAEATDEMLLAALDEALDEQADTPSPTDSLPVGAIVVDKGAYEELRSNAAAGRSAMDAIDKARRDGIIATALADGRISTATAEGWRAQLDTNEEGVASLLDGMPKNTAVPVNEIGHSAPTNAEADADAYPAHWKR